MTPSSGADPLPAAPAPTSGGGPAAAGAADGAQALRPRDRAPGEARRVAYLYLAPALLFYAVFALGPLLYTAWLSFFRWDGLTPGTWVGLDNYADVLGDEAIRSSFVHALVLIGFYSIIPVISGLALASILSHGHVRGVTLWRTLFFLPQTIATVVVAVAWVWVYAKDGPINQVLRGVGLDSLARSWIGDFDFALPALGIVGAWIMFGLCVVLFLAGMQRIPLTLYEAARVDGAGRLREFTVVTLPHLRGELAVALTVTMIFALRSFDLIYVATQGGPGTSTAVPSYLVYDNAFANGRVGLAAAIAVVLTIIILAVAGLIVRLVDRDPAR